MKKKLVVIEGKVELRRENKAKDEEITRLKAELTDSRHTSDCWFVKCKNAEEEELSKSREAVSKLNDTVRMWKKDGVNLMEERDTLKSMIDKHVAELEREKYYHLESAIREGELTRQLETLKISHDASDWGLLVSRAEKAEAELSRVKAELELSRHRYNDLCELDYERGELKKTKEELSKCRALIRKMVHIDEVLVQRQRADEAEAEVEKLKASAESMQFFAKCKFCRSNFKKREQAIQGKGAK